MTDECVHPRCDNETPFKLDVCTACYLADLYRRAGDDND
jgi:hypothetical protein